MKNLFIKGLMEYQFISSVRHIITGTVSLPIGRPGAVDGMWTSWTSWTGCTKSCDGGKRYRSRNCTNPEPKNNGLYCVGPDEEDRFCNIQRCRDG